MESFALPTGKISHVRCGACPIRERAVCAYCTGDALEALDGIKSYRSVDTGREIFAAGEPMRVVGSVVEGVVKLTKTLADGRTQMVGLLFPGDFIGHPTREMSEFDATAATDVTLCLFQRGPFATLLRETPSLEHRLLEMTFDDLDAARDWLLLLGRKTAREKLATFLLMLAKRARAAESDGPTQLVLPLTRAEIAEYLGLTIETVSRQMTRLRADGVVTFQSTRALNVHSIAQLEEVAGD